MSPRHCQRRDGFSWSRSMDSRGLIVYRLFWRSATGKLYMVSGTFVSGEAPAIIARDLRRLKHNLRVMRKALRIAA